MLLFVTDPDKTKVLLTKSRHPKHSPRWTGVAGSMAQGESPEEAAQRKFAEETRVNIPPEAWTEVTRCDNYIVLTATCDLAACQTVADPLIMYSLRANWNREPVVENLKTILPLVRAAS